MTASDPMELRWTDGSALPTAEQAAALFQAGRLEEAEAACERRLSVHPNDPETLHLSGAVALRRENFAKAEARIRQAIGCGVYTAAHFSNLGAALRGTGRPEAAEQSYRRAVAADPQRAEVAANFANLQKAEGDPGAARRWYTRAMRLRPDWPKPHASLGLMLLEARRYPEATAAFQRVVALCGTDADDAFLNLGMIAQKSGRLDEALMLYERVLARTPEHPSARWNRALVWLVLGRMPEGWHEYRFRWQLKGNAAVAHPQPRWGGEPLAGRRILVQAEQGLGDTLQFSRYLPLVAARGGAVTLECQASLIRLLRHNFPQVAFVEQGAALPAFDVHVPLLDLPSVFASRLEDIPPAPYLRAPPAQSGLALPGSPAGERRVGIVWGGEPAHLSDAVRSMPLDAMAPLFGLPGLRFFSLQKGPRAKEAEPWVTAGHLADAGRTFEDFADTAAFVAGLDLVITVDTSVAHLAGALGVPVWIMVAASPDWRWLLDRGDSPWYPSARLFRCAFGETWSHVVARIAYALGRSAGGVPHRSL